MQEYKIDIVLPDGNIEKANVEENTKIEELAKKYNPFFKNPVILSIYNGKLRELCKNIQEKCNTSSAESSSEIIRR